MNLAEMKAWCLDNDQIFSSDQAAAICGDLPRAYGR